MKIIVCVKQVPDTEANIKISADQKSVVESGLKFVVNPYDEFALEEALKIKEGHGGELVTAISIGPDRVKEALRAAIAMGVDEVLQLQTETMSLDALATAKALAAALKEMPFDLILMGKEAIDDGNQQVGGMLAELLGIPGLSVATKVSLENGKVVVERDADGGVEVLEAALPCIITCQKGLNEPRYPSIRGKMKAQKAVIPVKPAQIADSQISIKAIAYPPARGQGKVVGEGAAAVPELVRLLKTEARVI